MKISKFSILQLNFFGQIQEFKKKNEKSEYLTLQLKDFF